MNIDRFELRLRDLFYEDRPDVSIDNWFTITMESKYKSKKITIESHVQTSFMDKCSTISFEDINFEGFFEKVLVKMYAKI